MKQLPPNFWQSYIKHWLIPMMYLFTGLIVATILHGTNMFHFPYYENDEGVYLSQGFAVGFQNRMTDYTYWYDHIPGGWMMIALWLRLTGGPFMFGFSLYSGRMFMLVIHLLSSALLFFITKKLTGKNWPGFLAMIIFSLTPLGVYFQRRVLLDNIMTFWVLASILVVLMSKFRLRWIAVGGLFAAFAVLSKETAIVAIPPLMFLSTTQLKPRQRVIGLLLFCLPVVLGIGYFVLYALLKHELFPGPGHVSLIGTWAFQLSRGNKLPFWNPSSDFWSSVIDWADKDPWYIIMMFASLLWMIVTSVKKWQRMGVALVAVFFWLFMMRGGLVLNFYVVPMIALGALTTGVMFADLMKIRYAGLITILLLLGSWSFILSDTPWVTDETTPQLESVEWIKHNLPQQSIIAMDHFELIDMQESRFPNDPVFHRAHWFWKLEDDPTISQGVIQGDWQNIEYLVLTHEFIKQLGVKALPLLEPVLEHSRELASWGPLSSRTYVDIPKLTSTNGDWVKIYRVMDRTTIVLFDSWKAYNAQFITTDGQVMDHELNQTTSEGQSYAMLRAVAVGDRARFDATWQWTKDHLQFREHDKLISWKWEGDEITGKQTDSNFASDADVDIATALLLAHQTWGDQQYLAEAKEIIGDIWAEEILRLGNGQYVLIPGQWAVKEETLTLNPSYFSPAAFRLFATVDSQHPWEKVANDSYSLLEQSMNLSSADLPPDWIQINRQTGQVFSSTQPGKSSDFGYDAMRVFFRIAEDALWFDNAKAKTFLKEHRFLVDYWKEHQIIPAGFSLTGKPLVSYDSNAFYGAVLPQIKIIEPTQYDPMRNAMLRGYQSGQWHEIGNYYTQNWAWMGYALAEGKLMYER